MLDQVALACAIGFGICQEPMNYIELMVTPPNLKCLFLSGFLIFGLNYLRVVFEYVGETSPRQDSLP